MNVPGRRAFWLFIIFGLISQIGRTGVVAANSEAGVQTRIPWSSSRVRGSPDPPLGFDTTSTFTNIVFKRPLYLTRELGTESLLAVLQGGERGTPSRVLRFQDKQSPGDAQLLLEITNRLIYSVCPHPGYRTNGWLFVFSNGPTPEQDRTNRISRFTVNRFPPFGSDPASEQVILEWRSAGHDGGDMLFGRDGMMYISTGDGTSDSDAWNSGQSIDDLLGAILRIDVDSKPGSYTAPPDNPFVGWKDARPEIWAYGLRNPWRMSVDEKTGHIWVGVNGQDLWETAHLVRRGENYGWSVYEGSHPFYLNRRRGPTAIVPPTIEHHHTEMRSLTGGVVYYGAQFPELNGAYIYGDYSTGQIWAARHDETRLLSKVKIAQTQLQITAFTLDHRGGLLIVDLGGSIHRLVRAAQQSEDSEFPRLLSESGLFETVSSHRVAPGVLGYSVAAPAWNDGAEVQRFVALPGESQMEFNSSENKGWPEGAVLMQTFTIQGRRIETRVLTRQHGQWAGYSYKWNEQQSDATLVQASGDDSVFETGKWRYPSRSECMACHSRAANFVLAFTEEQLGRTHRYSEGEFDQLATLRHLGIVSSKNARRRGGAPLVDPYDSSAALEARARSYLHVNCSVCHVEAGGGNSMMELAITRPTDKMRLISARPQHDSFGLPNAMLVAPGEPDRSVLLERLKRRGPGQMPPVAIQRVDQEAVRLMREWIVSLKPEHAVVKQWQFEELLPLLARLDSDSSARRGAAVFEKAGCAQCHRVGSRGGTVGPDLSTVGGKLSPHELLESVVLPSRNIAEGFAVTEIELASDEIVTGFLENEDAGSVTLRPTSGGGPIVVAKDQIASRRLSSISNMPSGMADILTEREIGDLLAYLREAR